MNRIFLIGVLLFCLLWMFQPQSVAAQFSLDQIATGGANAQLKLVPSYPGAFETVTASLEAYTFDTEGASIQWFIDGSELPNSQNERSVAFSTGELGIPQTLTAQVTLRNGQRLSPAAIITPSRLDLIIEGDTTTPLHYQGRALPSVGSRVRVVAVPVTNRTFNDLSFTWTLGSKVLFGGPVLGKSVATFNAPQNPDTPLTVSVTDRTGTTLFQESVFLTIAPVEINFYENNPLRGISRNALANPDVLVSDEIIVRAEPYFMSPRVDTDSAYIRWEINNESVENPSTDPLEVTLRGGGGTGRFGVDLQIRNKTNLLQGNEAEFTIVF